MKYWSQCEGRLLCKKKGVTITKWHDVYGTVFFASTSPDKWAVVLERMPSIKMLKAIKLI
jgi:hypothetical protein